MVNMRHFFSKINFGKFQNFPERTKKEEIDALLSSYHIETTHTDKNNESCKVRRHELTVQVATDGLRTPVIFFGGQGPVVSIISSDKK